MPVMQSWQVLLRQRLKRCRGNQSLDKLGNQSLDPLDPLDPLGRLGDHKLGDHRLSFDRLRNPKGEQIIYIFCDGEVYEVDPGSLYDPFPGGVV